VTEDKKATRRHVLALGLDGFELSYAEPLMARGELPALQALHDRSACFRLDPGPAQRTGLSWEHFWSGLAPEAAHRASAVEFDPATYRVWQEGARFRPFFDALDVDAVVFDPPYADLALASGVDGVVAWGAHDPGVGPGASPASLRDDFDARVGPYPATSWVYGTPWPSPDRTREMCEHLIEAVERRREGARWLLTERFDDWDLGIVVVAETHGAAEGLWHGIDPAHPLHDHPSAAVAASGVAEIYRAVDRLVADVLDATQPDLAFVFSLGGMGSNHSDVASMALLPELMLLWSLGEHLLVVPDAWAADPATVPISPHPNADFMRDWYPEVSRRDRPGAAKALARRLPAPVRAPLKRAFGGRPRAAADSGGLAPGAPRPTGYQEPTWQPAAWYQPWWPRMRAFALPSFYDGRIRINLRGRERDGLVDPTDYDRVCDELEALVRACIDPRTGKPVVEQVERPAAGSDPTRLDRAQADLVVEWNACTAAFEHPVHGVVGPLPFRRTGGHTGPSGFAFVQGRGLDPGDRGAASSFDVAASIAALLAGHPVDGVSGTPLPLGPVG
jgi:hypothetical protein